MWKVQHKISASEIKFGTLSLRHSDGTNKVFKELPDRFTMIIRNKMLLERQIAPNHRSVWIGSGIMKMFEIGEIITVLRYEDGIVIEQSKNEK